MCVCGRIARTGWVILASCGQQAGRQGCERAARQQEALSLHTHIDLLFVGDQTLAKLESNRQKALELCRNQPAEMFGTGLTAAACALLAAWSRRQAQIGPGQLGLAGGAVLFGLVFLLVSGGDFATSNRYKVSLGEHLFYGKHCSLRAVGVPFLYRCLERPSA